MVVILRFLQSAFLADQQVDAEVRTTMSRLLKEVDLQ